MRPERVGERLARDGLGLRRVDGEAARERVARIRQGLEAERREEQERTLVEDVEAPVSPGALEPRQNGGVGVGTEQELVDEHQRADVRRVSVTDEVSMLR